MPALAQESYKNFSTNEDLFFKCPMVAVKFSNLICETLPEGHLCALLFKSYPLTMGNYCVFLHGIQLKVFNSSFLNQVQMSSMNTM